MIFQVQQLGVSDLRGLPQVARRVGPLCKFGVRPCKSSPRVVATEYPLGVVHTFITLTRLTPEEAAMHHQDLLARDFGEIEPDSATEAEL